MLQRDQERQIAREQTTNSRSRAFWPILQHAIKCSSSHSRGSENLSLFEIPACVGMTL
jgi:hypothetical protein